MENRPDLLLFCALMVALLTCCGFRQPEALPAANPEDVGLHWHECAVSAPYTWAQAEACFGHPMPLSRSEERDRWGERLGSEGWRLTIGADTYETRATIAFLPPRSWYTLSRNGVLLANLWGEFTAYSPNISLQNVAGKAVWEFADHRGGTVVYDGRDLRRKYGLSGAYRPYGLGDALILVGKRDGRYFVVYDGRQVGPEFEEILIAYCCEPLAWSVQASQGRYLFWGIRAGQSYVVEITSCLSW